MRLVGIRDVSKKYGVFAGPVRLFGYGHAPWKVQDCAEEGSFVRVDLEKMLNAVIAISKGKATVARLVLNCDGITD